MEHILEGLPQDKWIDIIFNASRGLATRELTRMLERQAAMEVLLEKRLGEMWEEELAYLQNSEESADEIHHKTQDLAIISMQDILTQNE
ncbi:DUF2018 family protein [Helicobacter turcicus]|uniref:DUF2018 family protein n=1 Tax=Helicobacter turcicus TaxID=2867412 RepID=A0ABS7JMY0_9HELI|nr:DUF2018 family protein [Helicobacter turcicus]MBX7490758.1 DUF2018 family protein [Helicobacter turcicus]MBX7545633.1 DUF2018 family protein [Helicobacter turcicus]